MEIDDIELDHMLTVAMAPSTLDKGVLSSGFRRRVSRIHPPTRSRRPQWVGTSGLEQLEPRVLLSGDVISPTPTGAPSPAAVARDLYSDTWVATDALGREVADFAEAGAQRSGTTVGAFYFLWHGAHGTALFDNTDILAANPGNPQWTSNAGQFHFWGEPEAGYYLATDPWVIRRNASMLIDAGVDFIYFDVSNAFTYPVQYTALMDVYTQIRNEGGHTPQFVFLAHSRPADTIRNLYFNLYSQNLYSDLWFQWPGKPLILGYDEDNLVPGEAPLSQQITDFFTLRESWAWDAGFHKWQWLDSSPQDHGWDVSPAIPEQIPVSVASHPTNNIGTSHQNGQQSPLDQYDLAATTGQGSYFDEQWGRAHAVDPQVIMVTGWNEWIAQRFESDGTTPFLGQTLPAGESFFVDAYNEEYNRDIEPMKDGHTDNYYYQLVDNVRKFKGLSEVALRAGIFLTS